MAWLCVPGMAVSSLDSSSSSPATALWVTSSGKPGLRPPSWRGWKRRPWHRLLFGTTSRPLMADRGVAAWISSLPESRVSPGRKPDCAEVLKTSVISGLTSSASCRKPIRQFSSSRTSPASAASVFQPYSSPLPTWGSIQSGVCFRRKPWAPLTAERDISSWPTPTATDSRGSRAAGYSTKSGRHSGTTLTDAVRMWPTPTANRGGTNRGGAAGRTGKVRPSIETMARHWTFFRPDQTTTAGKPSPKTCNPRFHAWLMGLPPWWTSARPQTGCACRAAALSRWRQRARGQYFRLVPSERAI